MSDKQRILALERKVAKLEKLGELLMQQIVNLNTDKRLREMREAAMDPVTGD